MPIAEVHGYDAGGAWLVRETQLCHVEPYETLRVRGVRPYGTLPEGSGLSVGVSADPEMGASLSARQYQLRSMATPARAMFLSSDARGRRVSMRVA